MTFWIWRRGWLKTFWGNCIRTINGRANKKRELNFWEISSCLELIFGPLQKTRVGSEKIVLIMQVFFRLVD